MTGQPTRTIHLLTREPRTVQGAVRHSLKGPAPRPAPRGWTRRACAGQTAMLLRPVREDGSMTAQSIRPPQEAMQEAVRQCVGGLPDYLRAERAIGKMILGGRPSACTSPGVLYGRLVAGGAVLHPCMERVGAPRRPPSASSRPPKRASAFPAVVRAPASPTPVPRSDTSTAPAPPPASGSCPISPLDTARTIQDNTLNLRGWARKGCGRWIWARVRFQWATVGPTHVLNRGDHRVRTPADTL